MLKEKRGTKLKSGPYKDLTRKDALFRELAKALLDGRKISDEELWKYFAEDERMKIGSVRTMRKGWEDWLLNRRPPGCEEWRCGPTESSPTIPNDSRGFAKQIRSKLTGKTRPPRAPSSSRQGYLPDDEADDKQSYITERYSPNDHDERPTVERQIKIRRGQQQFRDALRMRYGNRCNVTGCEVLTVLEAAHIKPYRGEKDNNIANGLLLRSDIHTLFDLDLIGIDPVTLKVNLACSLKEDAQYKKFDGTKLKTRNHRPSKEALEYRYKQFQQRNT